MTHLSREQIIWRIRAMIGHNIETYGMHVQGVLDNPPYAYSIGLLEPFGFEIISMGLPQQIAAHVFNSIHTSLKNGFKIELDKIYTPENTRWVSLPIKFIKADHPLIFDNWMIQAQAWWKRNFPVYQLVLSDAEGLLPGQEGFDHEYMDKCQQLLVAKK